MEALNIFPITIYKTEISNNDYLKNLMLSEILEASEHLSPPVNWFTNNLKTSFEGEPEGMEVIDKYRSTLESSYSRCLDEFFDKGFKVRLVDDMIWYNVYTDGEYQELHDHIPQGMNPFHWSCIHFLSYDKTIHNPPEFRDPIAQIRQFGVPMERDRVNEYYAPRVEEGSFLMFPTYLQHRVSSCIKSDYPRVTLSFNLRVLEYGNKRFKLD